MTTVLVHLKVDYLGTDRIGDRFPGVRFVHVDPDGPVDPAVHGEVVVTRGVDSPNFAEVLERGVEWVHCTGHGVDEMPLETVGNRILTCARGATAVPIAEWVVAMLLTAAKRLPGSWIDEPPERWFLTHLGTLEGTTVALLGYGSINRAVAARLAPFGCRLLAVRRTGAPVDDPGVVVVADAATALTLDFSVARALPGNPARVLGLVDRGFALQDICTSPFLEPEPGAAEAYAHRALVALESVSQPPLEAQARKCAEAIRASNP